MTWYQSPSLPGEMLLRTSAINSQLCSSVVSHAPRLRNPASGDNPFSSFDYLTVYHPEERTAVMELLTAVEKGKTVVMPESVHVSIQVLFSFR